jgi:hypothetical protein
MDTHLTVAALFGTLLLITSSGCITQPDRLPEVLTMQATHTATLEPSRNTPATVAQQTSIGTAQVTNTRTNRPAPEWTRPVAMTPPKTYARTIEKARQDLAARLGLDLTAIQFIKLNPDEFPADTLGCLGPGVTPRPIPAIVSGQVILLEAQGVRYTYHARKEQVVFCGPWK